MRAGLLAVVALLLPACVEVDEIGEASCPEQGTEHRYESFGAPFLGEYCQSCHARGADDRQGAPTEFSFDTVEDVRRHADRIYGRAAAGNISMPPGPYDPPRAERDALAEWLACGAP